MTVPLGAYPSNASIGTTNRGLHRSAPNIPYGIAFSGRHWSEPELIGYAYAFEQRTKVRYAIKPFLTPKTELVDIIGK